MRSAEGPAASDFGFDIACASGKTAEEFRHPFALGIGVDRIEGVGRSIEGLRNM